MYHNETAIIRVVCEERGDGGVRVSSPDVPGLHLSGADRDAVFADVGPAIQMLFKANQDIDIEWHPVVPSVEALLAPSPDPTPVVAAMQTGQFAITRATS